MIPGFFLRRGDSSRADFRDAAGWCRARGIELLWWSAGFGDDIQKRHRETEAPALSERAAAQLHIQSLGFTLEECQGAEAGRSVARTESSAHGGAPQSHGVVQRALGVLKVMQQGCFKNEIV